MKAIGNYSGPFLKVFNLSIVKQLAGVIVLLLFWEAGAFVIELNNPKFHTNIFPSLTYIFTESLTGISAFSTIDLTQIRHSSFLVALLVLAENSAVTLLRLLGGTLIGLFVGVAIGVAIGSSSLFRRTFNPLINTIRTVPLLALIPLFLVWFGGATIGIYLYIIFSIAMLMIIYTVNAIENVPPIFTQFAQTFGANNAQIFRTVILPAIIPELFGGIRISLGIAWGITLAAEYLGAQDGLGRILIWSQIYMYAGRMFIIVFLFMVYAIAINAIVLRLRQHVLRWMA